MVRSRRRASRSDTPPGSASGPLATIEAGNSDLAYRNQVASTSQTIAESNLIQMDAKRTTEEHAQAARDAEGAVYDQAAAAVRLAEDQAALDPKVLAWSKEHATGNVPLAVFEDPVEGAWAPCPTRAIKPRPLMTAPPSSPSTVRRGS